MDPEKKSSPSPAHIFFYCLFGYQLFGEGGFHGSVRFDRVPGVRVNNGFVVERCGRVTVGGQAGNAVEVVSGDDKALVATRRNGY